MEIKKKSNDVLGIGKRFKVEFLEHSSYKEQRIDLENGEVIPNVIEGILENYTNPSIGHIFIKDDDGGVNIIPINRIVSMMHIKEHNPDIVYGGLGNKAISEI